MKRQLVYVSLAHGVEREIELGRDKKSLHRWRYAEVSKRVPSATNRRLRQRAEQAIQTCLCYKTGPIKIQRDTVFCMSNALTCSRKGSR